MLIVEVADRERIARMSEQINRIIAWMQKEGSSDRCARAVTGSPGGERMASEVTKETAIPSPNPTGLLELTDSMQATPEEQTEARQMTSGARKPIQKGTEPQERKSRSRGSRAEFAESNKCL